MLTFCEIQSFKSKLRKHWDPEVELCGIVNEAGEIEETKNVSGDPKNRFEFLLEDLNRAQVSWHSHPSGTANLSIADYRFFQSWPSLTHFIVSIDEVRCYGVHEGMVYLIEQENDHPLWAPRQEVSSQD